MPDAGRVVTGTAKGLRLDAPGAGTRPLSDRLKQALFSALGAESGVLDGGDFLDLFAGSGAAGIEALSRGAARAVLVEHDRRACAVIRRNLERSGLDGGSLVCLDVLRFLRQADPVDGGPFDACFIDPPYNQPLVVPVLELLGEPARGWVRADSVVVAKHFWRDAPPATLGALTAYRRKRQGETMLSFYRQ
jgi:16S rRNA (guanine966-N2)-methyltransferase